MCEKVNELQVVERIFNTTQYVAFPSRLLVDDGFYVRQYKMIKTDLK